MRNLICDVVNYCVIEAESDTGEIDIW